MFCYSGQCISSINPNLSLRLDNPNTTSCMKLRKETEVIPLQVNKSCVNGSDVSFAECNISTCSNHWNVSNPNKYLSRHSEKMRTLLKVRSNLKTMMWVFFVTFLSSWVNVTVQLISNDVNIHSDAMKVPCRCRQVRTVL